jgi:hypothetical protein
MTKVHGNNGERIIASAGPEKKPLPQYDDRFEIIERSNWFPRKYNCGHMGARWFRIHAYGEESKKIRQKENCPECFLADVRQHIIHCCLCGLPIVPGDPVALYGGGEDIKLDIATVLSGGSIVGCLRWDCCPSGGFFAGHWTENGFQSAFNEGRSAAEECMATGEVVARSTEQQGFRFTDCEGCVCDDH